MSPSSCTTPPPPFSPLWHPPPPGRTAHARAHFTAAGTPVHAAVLSPASDGYVASKAATAAAAGAAHRVAMATAAAAEVPWLVVDGVEAAGQVRLPTADAVAGVARRVRAAAGGVPLRPVVVFGVDVVADFTDARKWPPANVRWGRPDHWGGARVRAGGGEGGGAPATAVGGAPPPPTVTAACARRGRVWPTGARSGAFGPTRPRLTPRLDGGRACPWVLVLPVPLRDSPAGDAPAPRRDGGRLPPPRAGTGARRRRGRDRKSVV